ncbi:S-adenosyl-L-methionine-dependent methyltransferase [Fomitopsis serialis]|uniref:S-adenosyl-L-methionine-dependent methyltransferase n=1 Tax=Fomitopsis serialis TaxID=139415 RepID=UPI0020075339|nr:S-adenosyl-L-methionine-dependent methyltransferase [Neoantrodia serialis]KAH9926432.1 S-adenosyl-L-methionine-dependent methyltransferase [Neoantrodia serialis]
MDRVRELIREDPSAGWDKAWQQNVTPWDAGQSQPPLRDLLESDEVDLPRSGRALVPGCGRGYDVILIATALGLETTGLDISPVALEAARAHAASSGLPAGTKVNFEGWDFFTLAPSPGEQYDLIYDYTFFVAIQPSRRPEWGRQMSALVKSGGYLITLAWPLAPEPYESGPPHYSKPEHYAEVLGDGWEKVLDKEPEHSLERHVGCERLIVYRSL